MLKTLKIEGLRENQEKPKENCRECKPREIQDGVRIKKGGFYEKEKLQRSESNQKDVIKM